ncbi:MAG TPA: response regulator [Aggregatilineaceae bacterium]|nr:response regulator [Aggregatilineaceae bacterium]
MIPDNLLEGWNIVVLDDEEDSLEVAEIILTEYGATVHTAADGQEGLDIVRRIKPRFVISDLSMPTMDGWGFIHAMKDDPGLAEIPAIALTAHAMVGDRERAVAAGFHNYLTKPLTVDTFMADLVKLLIDIPVLAEALNI